jgi:hypothetical protein
MTGCGMGVFLFCSIFQRYRSWDTRGHIQPDDRNPIKQARVCGEAERQSKHATE